MNYNYDKPSILSVNVLYLIVGLMLLFIGFLVQSYRLYLGLLVTEYVLILIPNILFIKMRGHSLKRVLRLNGFTLKQVLYTILIVLFSYPIAVFFNFIIMSIINSFIDFVPAGVPIPLTPQELVISFLIIGVTPGICEEVMFRGTMLSAYESKGYGKSIIMTSLLFGIFHFNITNLVGPIFLGIIFGIIALKSNTIFLPMIGHTLNNGIALLIGYFATKYTPELDDLDVSLGNGAISETAAMIASTITLGIIALLCGLVIFKLLKSFPTRYRSSEVNIPSASNSSRLKYLPVIIVLIKFVIITWFILKNV